MSSTTHVPSLLEATIERVQSITIYGLMTGLPVMVYLVSPPLGIAAGIWGAFKFISSSGRSSTTHGSSRWASLIDLMRSGCVFRPGLSLGRVRNIKSPSRIFDIWVLLTWPLSKSAEANAVSSLAGNQPEPIELVLPDKTPHCAIYGASGSGKSTSFAIPHAQQFTGSIVVLDAKGEICRQTARWRADQFGSEIVVIDPFGVAEGCGFPAARYNPLDLMRACPEKLVDEARRLAGSLVVESGNEKDPFWNKASTTLITGVAAFLVAEGKPEFATLNHLREIMSSSEMIEDMLEHMKVSEACGGLLRRIGGQISQLQGQTKASVYSVANSHVDFLDSLAISDTLSTSTFDANQLVNGNQSIYLCLPVDRITELSSLQRVILSSLINVVFAAGEDRHRRVQFILDEAATLGPMEALYNSVQFGRSFGHRMSFYFQSVSQVERCFPESQAQDFRATTAEVFCGVANLETAKEVSDWIGATTVMSSSEQDSSNWGGNSTGDSLGGMTNFGRNWGGSYSCTINETGRALIMPEEVLQLPEDEAIVLIPGVPPVRAEKVPHFTRLPAPSGAKRFQEGFRKVAFVAASWSGMALVLWHFLSASA